MQNSSSVATKTSNLAKLCSHFRDSLERVQCPNPQALLGIYDKGDVLGVIVTVRGATPYDFLSRYFAPWNGIPEDPVTGAYVSFLGLSHWADLENNEFSNRGTYLVYSNANIVMHT